MASYGYGFLIGIVLTVIFWFLFVAPMERRMHERKMKMMKRKLARNEERLKKLRRQDREGCIEKAENSRDGASPNNNV
jgi:uncharacterized membrane protein (DUF106 family)